MNKSINDDGDDLSMPNVVDHEKDNNQGLLSDVPVGDRQKLETTRYGRVKTANGAISGLNVIQLRFWIVELCQSYC